MAEAANRGAREPLGSAIVVLTGAGVSRESGLATFLDPDVVWAEVRGEDIATPRAFARDPSPWAISRGDVGEGRQARVHAFYYSAWRRRRTRPAL